MTAALLGPVLWLFNAIVNLILLVVLVYVVLSWLISFEVVNRRNQVVDGLWRIAGQITEPMLRPIRKMVPPIGGMDLSPLIFGLGLMFIQLLVNNLVIYFMRTSVL